MLFGDPRYNFKSYVVDEIEDARAKQCNPIDYAFGRCKDNPDTPEIEHLNENFGQIIPSQDGKSIGQVIPPRKQRAGGEHIDNCSKECGSYFNPLECGCYLDKMTG